MSKSRLSLLLLALLAALALEAPSALAAPAFYDGNSADGSAAVFSTVEPMVPGDTDQQEDVYVRGLDTGLGEYVTREVSIGPKGGNDAQAAHFDGTSRDGNEVFFSTKEAMVAADTDHAEDVYVRILDENRTVLVSQGDPSCSGQGCGNGEFDVSFLPGGVAPEGEVVFFGSNERLGPGDEDGAFDVYARNLQAETTALVSAPDPTCSGCGNEGLDPLFRGTDDAGDVAFFTSKEKLASADTDSGEEDVYARALGPATTSLVSIAGTCPPGLPVGQSCEPSYGGASADGSHVFYETNERVSGSDTDSSQDVYDWSAGAVNLVSIGPAGGNGTPNVTYAGTSPDGSAAYFETSEPLVAADTDSAQDVYRRSAGTTELVSAGEAGKGNLEAPASFEWVSTSGPPVVVFTTAEALTAADTDSAQDVYKRAGGVTTLLSIGPEGGSGEGSATFAFASEDGSKVFFTTTESLLAADADTSLDAYLRSGSQTSLVSAGQVGGNGAFGAGLRGIAADGSRAFFTTQERLTVDDDFLGETDLYGWSAGTGTLLVSVKNSPDLVLGPPPPTLEGTSPASPSPTTTPAVFGQAVAESSIKVYTSADCSGEPVAQGTAVELASPGLTVTVPVLPGTTTNYRATAEAEGVVSPCSAPITYRQEDAPPPPEEEGGGGSGGGGSGGGGGSTGGGTTTGGGTRPGGGKGGNQPGSGGIQYVVPVLKITFGPVFKTRLRRPVFRFADTTGQPGTTFFCRVDRHKWGHCTSPLKLKKQKVGRHVFSVKAYNALGTPGARPVRRPFKVVKRR